MSSRRVRVPGCKFCDWLFVMGFNKPMPVFSVSFCKTKATYLTSKQGVLFNTEKLWLSLRVSDCAHELNAGGVFRLLGMTNYQVGRLGNGRRGDKPVQHIPAMTHNGLDNRRSV